MIDPAQQATTTISVPGLIRKNTIYIAIVLALQGLGGQLAVTLGALMVVQLLGKATLAGVGGSILSAGRILMPYPTGKLTDIYGRKPGMIISLILSLIGGSLLGASITVSSFPILLSGMIILGLGIGSARQLNVAAVDMYPSTRRGEGLGYVLTGSIASAFIAPVVVAIGESIGRITERDPLGISWYLMLLVLLPTVFFILLIKPDPRSIALNLSKYWPSYDLPQPRSEGTPPAAISTLLRHRPKQITYACYAAAQGTMSLMMVMTSLVMAEGGHPIRSISITVSIHVLGMFAFSIPFGKLADRIGRKPLLGVGLVIEAFGAFLVPITQSYTIITLALFFIGIGWSAVNISGTSLLADTTLPEERGRAIGLNETLSGILSIGMPLLGGFVVDVSGLTMMGIIGGSVSLIPLIFLLRLKEVNQGHYIYE